MISSSYSVHPRLSDLERQIDNADVLSYEKQHMELRYARDKI